MDLSRGLRNGRFEGPAAPRSATRLGREWCGAIHGAALTRTPGAAQPRCRARSSAVCSMCASIAAPPPRDRGRRWRRGWSDGAPGRCGGSRRPTRCGGGPLDLGTQGNEHGGDERVPRTPQDGVMKGDVVPDEGGQVGLVRRRGHPGERGVESDDHIGRVPPGAQLGRAHLDHPAHLDQGHGDVDRALRVRGQPGQGTQIGPAVPRVHERAASVLDAHDARLRERLRQLRAR